MEHDLNQPLEILKNPWPKSFQEDRNPAEEETFLESRLRFNPTNDHLLTFLRDCDEHTAEEEVITYFCSSVHLSALTKPCANPLQRAWLDDRQWHRTSSSNPRGTHAQNERNHAFSRTLRLNNPDATTIDVLSKDIVDEPRTKILLPLQEKHKHSFREYKPPLGPHPLLQHLREKVCMFFGNQSAQQVPFIGDWE
jgi:hypothetical protein